LDPGKLSQFLGSRENDSHQVGLNIPLINPTKYFSIPMHSE